MVRLYVDKPDVVCLDAAPGISAGSLAVRYTVYLLGAWLRQIGSAGWPAVSNASNKALFQRVELDTPSFRPESPSLDSRTPLLTPNVTKSTRTKFDVHRRLDQVAKVPGMCSGHTCGLH
jgi:hypothetical protein